MKEEKQTKHETDICDDCKDVVRSYGLDQKTKFDDETLSVERVIISSDAIDSYETKFDVYGVNLDRFATNPILLFNHNDYSSLPIGKVGNIRQEDNLLLADIKLENVTNGEVSGKNIYSLLKAGFLNGFSIRFEPLEAHKEIIEDKEITVFDKWRLLEVSVVNLPANPQAVVTRSQAQLTKDDVKAMFEELRDEEEAKRQQAEKQRQALSTDLSAALKNAYRQLGKVLAESKK